jgi:hypothetical protein
MKSAIDDFLKPKEETATASPGLGDNFSLAGESEDDSEGEGLLGEVQGKLATATPDQLEKIKAILEEGGESDSMKPPPGGSGDMGMPM